MTLDNRLPAWSTGLLAEIFGDHDGDGRPLTVIVMNEDTLARAASKGGVTIGSVAQDDFLSAFPGRETLARWFSGSEYPGPALPAFLMLCCLAACEAADLEANDYRQRLKELFGWPEPVNDCRGLPLLWQALEDDVRVAPNMRPFKLPDPGVYRSLIGHAIELTFPSRPDAGKLRTILGNNPVDADRPTDVIALLEREAPKHNFTTSFRDAFRAFRAAWKAGHRALVDDRFWVGWRLIATTEDDIALDDLFVVADEYGDLHLAGERDGPLDLFEGVRRREFSRQLSHLVDGRRPLFLADAGWRRWEWTGDDRDARRRARAALIWNQNYRGDRLLQFDRSPVHGAPGWSFTTALDVLLTSDERRGGAEDSFFSPVVGGVARVHGGFLCRPSFPLTIKADLPVGSVKLRGDAAGLATIDLVSGSARISFRESLTADLVADVESRTTGDVIARAVRPRASALAPRFNDPPARLAADEELTLRHWTATTDAPPGVGHALPAPGIATSPKVLDLLELLACRTGALPFAGLLEILEENLDIDSANAWNVIRSLEEAAALRVFRNRGWGGRSVMANRPRSILARTPEGWSMRLEGVVNDTLLSRLGGAARQRGLHLETRAGITEWAVPTAAVAAHDAEVLLELAKDVELEAAFLRSDLSGLPSLARLDPDGDGRNHPDRARIPLAENISRAGIALFLCKRETNDAPRLWLVSRPNAADRYWSTRNDALLDIHLATGVSAFRFEGGQLWASARGCRLPMNLARWLRLATGMAGGPTHDGYFYAAPAWVVPHLRRCLGDLIERDRPFAAPPSSSRDRSRSRGTAMAVATNGATVTIEPWRRARALGRH